MKGKLLISLIPVALIVFLVLIILAIIAACFGNEETIIRSNFTLPFNTDKYVITSPFGTRTDPISFEVRTHNGVDVVPSGTTDILAVSDGVVVSSSLDSAGAEYVIIEHDFGNTKYRTGYWHLKENSRVVKVGDKVKQGQQIGIMGSTGYSTGPHLHLFLQEYNTSTNQFEYKDPISIIENKVLPTRVMLYNYETHSYKKSNYFDNKNLLDPSNKYELPTFNQ